MKRLPLAICLVLALFAAAIVAGCGEEEAELHVVEGEPLEMGDLSYTAQISRYLNPDDPEDRGYLAGQEPPDPEQLYFGVFLTIENETGEDQELPDDFVLRSTEADAEATSGTGIYEPIPSNSVYALQLPGLEDEAQAGIDPGTIDDLQPSTVPADEELPLADTTAADGVIGGAMLLFLVDEEVAENRPLELEVPGDPGAHPGFIELDI
jgi:hypothetical protein